MAYPAKGYLWLVDQGTTKVVGRVSLLSITASEPYSTPG